MNTTAADENTYGCPKCALGHCERVRRVGSSTSLLIHMTKPRKWTFNVQLSVFLSSSFHRITSITRPRSCHALDAVIYSQLHPTQQNITTTSHSPGPVMELTVNVNFPLPSMPNINGNLEPNQDIFRTPSTSCGPGVVTDITYPIPTAPCSKGNVSWHANISLSSPFHKCGAFCTRS